MNRRILPCFCICKDAVLYGTVSQLVDIDLHSLSRQERILKINCSTFNCNNSTLCYTYYNLSVDLIFRYVSLLLPAACFQYNEVKALLSIFHFSSPILALNCDSQKTDLQKSFSQGPVTLPLLY